jgi:hypothetical protein
MLSFDNILAIAEREVGAYGLPDEALLGRVRGLVDWINERGPYERIEIKGMHEQIRRLLANRIKLLNDRRLYPAIAEEKIERPIFVVGFARSGTTLIHSLLAEDPQVLAPQSWHMYAPSPPPGAMPVVPERYAFAQRQVEHWMDFCPAQRPMHPYTDKGAFQLIEDEEIHALDFRNTYCYHFYKVPTMAEILWLDPDPVGAFKFHHDVLQHLQWQTGRKSWVCKGVNHQGNLRALFDTYPDALCIWPHRPMVDICASIALLSASIYDTITGVPGDIKQVAKTIAEYMKAGFDQMMADDVIDDPRLVHIPFKQVAANPIGVIKDIYARTGRTVSPEFEQRMQAWLDAPENRVDRYGRYPYDYEPLGLDRKWVEDLFADYSKRFGLE